MLLNGKKVFVGRFVPRKDREIELGEKAKMFTNVFIKNLSEDVEEGALLEMFEAFGKITSLKVMKGTLRVPLFPSVLFSFCFDFLKHKTEGFPRKTFSFAMKGKSLFPSGFF